MRDVLRVENWRQGLKLSASVLSILLHALQHVALFRCGSLMKSKATSHSDWLPSSVMRLKKTWENYDSVVFACVTTWIGLWVGYILQLFQTVSPRSHEKGKNENQQPTKLAALNWRSQNTYSTPSIFCFAGSHCCLSRGRPS